MLPPVEATVNIRFKASIDASQLEDITDHFYPSITMLALGRGKEYRCIGLMPCDIPKGTIINISLLTAEEIG